MNFEFDFFGIDRLFSVPIARPAEEHPLHDWILVTLHSGRRSWLLLQLDRSEWKDDSAALELANVIAARRLSECDGLALGTPQWATEIQKRQLSALLENCSESGEGRWADSRLPRFKWFLVQEGRNLGDQ
jgi:hypothetical protein